MVVDREAEARKAFVRAMYDFLVWLWMEEDAAKKSDAADRARELEKIAQRVARRLMVPDGAPAEVLSCATYADAREQTIRHLQAMVRVALRDAMKADVIAAIELEWLRENMQRAFRDRSRSTI
ncbi:hypothetical protein LZC95_20185 [Pendulispora brunnea]|uniref:Uncharacterized protein n=1 Tax=Pendulispora brunnea TaxID=2905690 RepID=A0ABZ2KP61_9BACT